MACPESFFCEVSLTLTDLAASAAHSSAVLLCGFNGSVCTSPGIFSEAEVVVRAHVDNVLHHSACVSDTDTELRPRFPVYSGNHVQHVCCLSSISCSKLSICFTFNSYYAAGQKQSHFCCKAADLCGIHREPNTATKGRVVRPEGEGSHIINIMGR